MSTTQQNGRATLDFSPVQFDVTEMEAEVPEGEWEATCKIKKHVSKEARLPMIIVEWKLENTDNEALQTHLGKTIGDFVGFPSAGAKGGNFRKIHLRQLCEATGIDLDLVPKGNLSSWDDIEPFIEALDGSKAIIYTTVKEEATGEKRVNIKYAKPASFGAASAVSEDDEEEVPAKKTAAKAKAAPAKGKPARR